MEEDNLAGRQRQRLWCIAGNGRALWWRRRRRISNVFCGVQLRD